jgi:hypothetical protein
MTRHPVLPTLLPLLLPPHHHHSVLLLPCYVLHTHARVRQQSRNVRTSQCGSHRPRRAHAGRGRQAGWPQGRVQDPLTPPTTHRRLQGPARRATEDNGKYRVCSPFCAGAALRCPWWSGGPALSGLLTTTDAYNVHCNPLPPSASFILLETLPLARSPVLLAVIVGIAGKAFGLSKRRLSLYPWRVGKHIRRSVAESCARSEPVEHSRPLLAWAAGDGQREGLGCMEGVCPETIQS